MDDSPLSPDEPRAPDEPLGPDEPRSETSPDAGFLDEPVFPRAMEPAPAAPRSGAGRTLALLAIGLLGGLGAGYLLFRSEPVPVPSASATGGGAESFGVDVTNDPVLGRDDAPITIVEFSDFDCPFCTRFATQTAPRLRAQYGQDIRWVFVNLPLQGLHPRAYEAALAGECAHDQDRFWAWYDAMFSGRFDSSNEGLAAAAREIGVNMGRWEQCVAQADHAGEVAADLREAEKFYILGTPTFFVNGHRLEGAQPAEAFAAVIDSILQGS